MESKALVDIVGEEIFHKICERLGGMYVYIPTMQQHTDIIKKLSYKEKTMMVKKLFHEGQSIAAIAEEMHTSTTTIYSIIRREIKKHEHKLGS